MIDNRSQQHKYKDKKSGKLILHENSALVPRAGVEPARVLPHWCLRPTRLPIPPPGHFGFKIGSAKIYFF